MEQISTHSIAKVGSKIDHKFNSFKLILLGLIIVAIPFLFLLQANNGEKAEKEKEEIKLQLIQSQGQVAKLQSDLQYKKDIIRIYSDLFNKNKIKIPILIYDTVRSVIFDKQTDTLIMEVGNSNFDGSNLIQHIPLSDTSKTYIRKLCDDYFKVHH